MASIDHKAIGANVTVADRKQAALERVFGNPNLPSPPALAVQIVKSASDPECEFDAITELLNRDPALCAKLLKTVNSCLYSLTRPVTTVRRAVTLLGLHPLRSLVLGLSLPAMQARHESPATLRQFWKRSLAGAIIARELAKRANRLVAEDVFVACLVRDLGEPLMSQAFASEYSTIWNDQRLLRGEQQCARETQLFGIHHAEVGAKLLGRWSFPEDLVASVAHHHHPQNASAGKPHVAEMARFLEFSSRLVRLDEAARDPRFLREVLDTARTQFSFKPPELQDLLIRVHPQAIEFANVMCVDIGACPNFAEILAAGCAEHSRLSESVASTSTPSKAGLSTDLVLSPSASGASQMTSPQTGEYSLSFLTRLGKPGQRVVIQDYEVVEQIGRGGVGVVLKARDMKLERMVALKLLAAEYAKSTQATLRFAREARTSAAIMHENVVTTFSVSEWCGVSFLVMEYIRGKSLQDWLDKGRKFSIPEVVRIGQQCAAGLAAAHQLRIIHRDIKPANILLDQSNERVRITDFGLARAVDDQSSISRDGTMSGTPLFMSPEQVTAKPMDHRTDLFSLGSLLYTLCTCRVPFQGDSIINTLYAVLNDSATPIRWLNPQVPESLADLIEEMHAKDPEKRLPTAAMAAARLATIAIELGQRPAAI